MTIICASLGQNWIAVSSDSFRTTGIDERTLKVLEDQMTKIVTVKNKLFHGAISWCGYCGDEEEILPWFVFGKRKVSSSATRKLSRSA